MTIIYAPGATKNVVVKGMTVTQGTTMTSLIVQSGYCSIGGKLVSYKKVVGLNDIEGLTAGDSELYLGSNRQLYTDNSHPAPASIGTCLIKCLKVVIGENIQLWGPTQETLEDIVQIPKREHNDLQNIQGGSLTERYHLTQSNAAKVEAFDTPVGVPDNALMIARANRGTWAKRTEQRITVGAGQTVLVLSYSPLQDDYWRVEINGVDSTDLFTISGNILTYVGTEFVLGIKDIVRVRYHYL